MQAGIALGSNIGDRLNNLRRAFGALRKVHAGAADQLLVSSVYQTAPVDSPPGAGWYLNAVVGIDTDLPPRALLHRLQQIEGEMGRPSERPRNAPRAIDLDLLYAGEAILRDRELTLPHPRLAQRAFVLVPLAEIKPSLVLPDQSRPVSQLLAALRSSEIISKLPDSLDEG